VTGTFPVSYTYSYGLPISVTGNGQTIATAVTYNPAAGLNTWTAGNSPGTAIITTITQDASLLPRPTQIQAKQGSTVKFNTGTYSYDGAGNILGTTAGSDSCVQSFGYDSRSRLTSATLCSGSSRNFTYDRWGNLLTNGTLSYPVSSSTNRLVVGGSTTAVVYDGRGNLTTHNADGLSYDSLDRQYRNTNGGSDWAYLYDGAGERVVKFPGGSSVLRREMARLIAEANIAA
jgi:YD repeat-containing protein